ncbi:MAG: hypothetical protein GX804_09975 [Lentisphaerae bacterium]|nr:hypothetical protein [Lentisphaerota bacterium]
MKNYSKTVFIFLTIVAMSMMLSSQTYADNSQSKKTLRVMEPLGRGVVALNRKSDVFITWRLLGVEPQDTAFNVYRISEDGTEIKLNDKPLTGATCFADSKADRKKDNAYKVKAVINNVELPDNSVPFKLRADTPREAPLEIPILHREHYSIHFAWVGVLTGDGEYDFVIDRIPRDNPDPDATQKVEAYTRHGKHLWTIDMGPQSVNKKGSRWNAGAATISNGHNDGLTVYDFDLDGRAEVAIQTARGVVFGDGKRLEEGDDTQQFISIIDGRTGVERTRTPLPQDFSKDGPMGGHFGVAYLDGVRPSIIYKAKNRDMKTRIFNAMINAWTFDGKKLEHNWKYIIPPGLSQYHQIRIVDVDGDGRDEIIDGGYALAPDGTLLWKLENTCHGDRFHIGKMDPDRPGLQGFAVQQNHSELLHYFYYDARTGEILRKHYGKTKEDIGRGIVADIDPNFPGYEYWAFGDIHNAVTGETVPGKRLWPNFRIWWDGNPGSSILNRTIIDGWNHKANKASRQLTGYRFGATHSWRDAPIFYGDIIGDWREEVVFEHRERNKLLVFTTPYSTDIRLYTLPHNPCYRAGMTVKGYMQSHMIDYFVGYGMTPPPAPQITVPGN